MVLPLGPAEAQRLTVIDKRLTGSPEVRKLVPVRFSELETVR
jgi:protein-L-isoaspartate(D-aspartate) O-methyltransferase